MKKYALFVSVYSLVFVIVILIAKSTSNAISVLSNTRILSERTCVIIDPGHGGVDGGATSCTGVVESALNLQIAIRLNDILHLVGIDTTMIRTTDISVYTEGNSIAQKKISDLKQRVKIVNETENAILLSIHQNHFSDSKYYGPQVFYGADISKAFACNMQNSLNKNLCPESNRQAKKATGVYLMDNIKCVGLLIECGFISNPEEEAKLCNSLYQQELAAVIAASCLNNICNSNAA